MKLEQIKKELKEIKTTIILREKDKTEKPLRIVYAEVLSNLNRENISGYSVNLDNQKTTLVFRREYINKKFSEFIGLTTKEHTDLLDFVKTEKLFQELNILVNSTLKARKEDLLN